MGVRSWLMGIVLVAGAGVSCASVAGHAMPAVSSAGVRFSVVLPEAGTVAVAGSFNGWSVVSDPLTRGPSGLWRGVVPMPPGEHTFMYVVDGARWMTPPLAEGYVDDGFGSRNGVVVVRPAQR